MPLASPAEWLSVAAFALALVYLATILYLPRSPSGLLLLPLVLGLVAASHVASHQPFAPDRTFYFWGLAHGLLLLFGTVTMCIGFLAGVMYLAQSYALKHAKSPSADLAAAQPRMARAAQRPDARRLDGLDPARLRLGRGAQHFESAARFVATSCGRDPVVQSSAAMLLWLFAAEAFRLVYPAARQGRKVAYLTLASFAFVVITVSCSRWSIRDTVVSNFSGSTQPADLSATIGSSRAPTLGMDTSIKLAMVGCSHRQSSLAVRERLAFSPTQTADALAAWHAATPRPKPCCSRPATASSSTPPPAATTRPRSVEAALGAPRRLPQRAGRRRPQRRS